MKVSKKDGATVAQDLMGNLKAKVRAFSLGDEVKRNQLCIAYVRLFISQN